MPKPTAWRVGTVMQIRMEAPGVRTYTFSLDEPVYHKPGQHYEIRLTAEDGYQAARLYSAASPASGKSNMLQLTIGIVPYGEVSPYMFRYARIGSQVEIRGPLGNYFVWTPEQTEPVLLIGGGTGIIPLRSMLMSHMLAGATSPMMLLYSVRSYHDVIYKNDLVPERQDMPANVILTFTEQAPRGWNGYHRRIDAEMVAEVLGRFDAAPTCYVCGTTPLVEAVTGLLVEAGLPADKIKAERFGPTG